MLQEKGVVKVTKDDLRPLVQFLEVLVSLARDPRPSQALQIGICRNSTLRTLSSGTLVCLPRFPRSNGEATGHDRALDTFPCR